MHKFSPGLTLLTAAVVLLASASAQQSSTSQNAPAKTPSTTHKPAASSSAAPLTTDKQKLSYALGMNIGKGLHHDGVDVDPNVFLRGMKDAMAGGKMAMTDEQAQQVMVKLQGELRTKMEAKRAEAEVTNKKDGDAFLAANKSKPGVVVLPSGLQYKVLKEGTGPKPTSTDSVKCNYRGTLVNGKEFDSSEKHGGPATFQVNGVIKGWTEALQLMPVGSKWQLVVPPDLAYAQLSPSPDIGPDETLVFEVELLAIVPKDQSQGQTPNSQ